MASFLFSLDHFAYRLASKKNNKHWTVFVTTPNNWIASIINTVGIKIVPSVKNNFTYLEKPPFELDQALILPNILAIKIKKITLFIPLGKRTDWVRRVQGNH